MEKGRRWLSQFYLREKERIGGRGETRKMMVDTNEFTGEFEKKIKHRSKDTTSNSPKDLLYYQILKMFGLVN